jgi:putative thioredoxin
MYEMKDFQTDVIQASFNKPVLVDFWAEWCGPCRMLSPVLEQLAEKYKENWTLVKINTDEHPEISQQFGIRGIPNVKLIINGNAADEFTGAMPAQMIEDWLKKAIPGKWSSKIEEAEKYFSESKSADAKKILEEVYSAEPENEKVRILLSKIILFDEPEKAFDLIKDIEEYGDNSEIIDSFKTIYYLIKRRRENQLPDGNGKEIYSTSIDHLSNQNFDEALSGFIQVIREDRNYDNDGARKACIAVFKYLGEESEVTIKTRRDFGSALYV